MALAEVDAQELQGWRKRNGLTQADAADLLGVSQPYLSLMEKGERAVTSELRQRLKAVSPSPKNTRPRQEITDERFRGQLSAFGYLGFAHLTPSRVKLSPTLLLFTVLSQPNVDARVVEALPWLVREQAAHIDFSWLVRQVKWSNLQNCLGFLLAVSGSRAALLLEAVSELERSRLLKESTLCWDAMPKAMRDWVRTNRGDMATHWNVLTTLTPETASGAA